ncbi:hypothetical protein ABZ960_16705 [Streptomyces pseudovenezuelae]
MRSVRRTALLASAALLRALLPVLDACLDPAGRVPRTRPASQPR